MSYIIYLHNFLINSLKFFIIIIIIYQLKDFLFKFFKNIKTLLIILIILIINKIALLYELYIKNLDYLKYRFIFKKSCLLILERL